MIESCTNTDKHDEHYWQPNPILRASSWCPGATRTMPTPKTQYVVTAHTGGGSMGEAMDPQIAVLCDDEAQARTLADGMQNILSAYDKYGDWLVTYTPVEHINILPTLPIVNGMVTGSDGKTMKVEPGQVAIDLFAFVKSWHEDIDP